MKKVPQRFHKNCFVQTQKADRFCSKCRQVPLIPHRSSCCKTIYCGICQPKVTVACVKCKGKPVPFKKDQDLTSKISKVKIKCPNIARGCTWKGEVYKLKNHLPDCIAIKEGTCTLISLVPRLLPIFFIWHEENEGAWSVKSRA